MNAQVRGFLARCRFGDMLDEVVEALEREEEEEAALNIQAHVRSLPVSPHARLCLSGELPGACSPGTFWFPLPSSICIFWRHQFLRTSSECCNYRCVAG